ncbi:MAG: 50S ribosomal protein L35 [Phycisphaerae bacterium]|jgi:large subunit ribosomal protein L35
MPKQKTHKGLTKRVKVTARKKVVRSRAFTGHLLSGRPSKRLRRLHRKAVLPKADTQRVLRALGQ